MEAVQTRHPSDQALHAYGLGKLDEATAESVNKHVGSCPACRERVAGLTSDSLLGRLRDVHGQVRPDPSAPAVSSTDGLSAMSAASLSAAPPPASTLPPGLADHADYEILRELGRGVWTWSTWPRTSSWGGWRCSRLSAATSPIVAA